MSRGSNGLRPIENLAERQKCPEAPTKRKFHTTTEAWEEARKRTEESGIEIAPYACAGCGFYHLTKKVTGSDTLTRQDGGKVVTGAQRKNMHPVFGKTPERVTLPEPEEEPLPGNHDARVKFALAVLEHNPEPTTADIQAACGCSKDAVRAVMHELGYRNTKGRHAVWRKGAEAAPEPQIGEDDGWSTLDLGAVNHMPIGDLLAAYRLIGVELRVQARP